MIRNALIFIFLSAGSLWAGNLTQPTFNQGVTAIQARIHGSAGSCVETDTELNQLSAFWPFNEGTGTSVADVSTGTHAMTLVNTPSWEAGKCGNGLAFAAASSEHATIINSPIIGGASVFTISAWAKSSANVYQIIYSEASTGSDIPSITISLAGQNDTFYCQYRDDGSNDGSFGTADLNSDDGNWHHIVFVQRATNDRELFIDGTSRATNATDCSSGFTLTQSEIGRIQQSGFTGDYMDGSIDQLRVYVGRAFTGGEVTALFNAGK